jgi:hypothetical protein
MKTLILAAAVFAAIFAFVGCDRQNLDETTFVDDGGTDASTVTDAGPADGGQHD